MLPSLSVLHTPLRLGLFFCCATLALAGPVTYSGKGKHLPLKTHLNFDQAIRLLRQHGYSTIIQLHVDKVGNLQIAKGPALEPSFIHRAVSSGGRDGAMVAQALGETLASQDYTAIWHAEYKLLWIKPHTAPDLNLLPPVEVPSDGTQDLDQLLHTLGSANGWELSLAMDSANWTRPELALTAGPHRLGALLAATSGTESSKTAGYILRTAVELHPDAKLTRKYADLIDVPK